MPLLCQVGVRGSQTIGFHRLEVLTAGAPAGHVGPADNLSFPLVIVGYEAFPPDLLAAAGGNVPGGKGIVFRWMPFLRQIRAQGR